MIRKKSYDNIRTLVQPEKIPTCSTIDVFSATSVKFKTTKYEKFNSPNQVGRAP